MVMEAKKSHRLPSVLHPGKSVVLFNLSPKPWELGPNGLMGPISPGFMQGPTEAPMSEVKVTPSWSRELIHLPTPFCSIQALSNWMISSYKLVKRIFFASIYWFKEGTLSKILTDTLRNNFITNLGMFSHAHINQSSQPQIWMVKKIYSEKYVLTRVHAKSFGHVWLFVSCGL